MNLFLSIFTLALGIYTCDAGCGTHHEGPYARTFQNFHGKTTARYTAKCEIECKNNGICVDTNTCQCPPNYQGQYCEFEKKPCLVFPPLPMNSYRKCSPDFCTITCTEGYKFIDGTSVMDMRCVNGKWQPTSAGLTSLPDCQPECNPPCLNGGVCLSVNTCQCPAGYGGAQCQYAKCENECKNNGICVDTNTCQCPPNYHGQYCEFEKNSCLLFPPLPMNSRRKCSLDYCTITCTEGYKFTDGTSVMDMRCVNGKWQPTRAGLTSIPDCQPECNLPCLNGGVCLSVNNCQCPTGFGGPQCQYGNS